MADLHLIRSQQTPISGALRELEQMHREGKLNGLIILADIDGDGGEPDTETTLWDVSRRKAFGMLVDGMLTVVRFFEEEE